MDCSADSANPSLACGGRCRQAEGGSNKLFAGSTPYRLIPALPRREMMIPSRAPKRDHDEWLVRWEVGWSGSRAGSGPKYRGMGRFADQAAINARGARCGVLQGGKAARIRGRGRWRFRRMPVARDPMLLAMRHGMRPSRGTISPKPRSAGEARASFVCGLTAAGIRPRRPRLLPHQPEAATPAGASSRK